MSDIFTFGLYQTSARRRGKAAGPGVLIFLGESELAPENTKVNLRD